jgi:fructose-bisphosphate aldolase class II
MDTDIRLAVTAAVRKSLSEKPDAFDPRGYLGAAREDIVTLVEKKITDVLGSEDSMK